MRHLEPQCDSFTWRDTCCLVGICQCVAIDDFNSFRRRERMKRWRHQHPKDKRWHYPEEGDNAPPSPRRKRRKQHHSKKGGGEKAAPLKRGTQHHTKGRMEKARPQKAAPPTKRDGGAKQHHPKGGWDTNRPSVDSTCLFGGVRVSECGKEQILHLSRTAGLQATVSVCAPCNVVSLSTTSVNSNTPLTMIAHLMQHS